MKKSNMMTKMSRSLHKVGFKLKKHSPEILVVGGVVGVVAGTVMACRATTKLSGILEEHKETINTIHDFTEDVKAGVVSEETYSLEDSKKDLTITYVQTGVKIAKLYAPAVAVGVISLTAIVSSHNILRKRNIALAAAYSTVNKSFKEYRGRVVERFGEELDKELRYNIKAKEVEEVTIDENGNEVKTKKVVTTGEPSEFAKFFDEFCTGWTKSPEHNLVFLKQQQAWANEKLRAQGYLFLNDVYDMLGIDRTQAGQIVGWVYDENDPHIDSYVDFGIYDLYDESKRDFVNGRERSILLDFNVDGDIWSLMQ